MSDAQTLNVSEVKPCGRCGWAWLCLGVLLAAHFIYIFHYFEPAISTPDANGYWAQGTLLAKTGQDWFRPESDLQYVGMHWLVTPDGRFFSRYPPGLPVVIGLVYSAFGISASLIIDPIFATLTLLGLFLILRRFFGPWLALAGAAVLASNPVFNEHALEHYAHMATACFMMWSVVCLFWWSDRGGWWRAFTAGVLLGCIPTIRYAEALFAAGALVFFLWEIRRPRLWRDLLAAGTGAALPLVPLLVRNQMAFGAFYRTGYALTNEQTGFGWSYFREHFIDYIRALNSDGVGLFFALGILGLASMCFVPRFRRLGVLLVLLVVPTTLLYMAYYWAGRGGGGMGAPGGAGGPGGLGGGGGMVGGGGGMMRFLVPTFACYVVGGIGLLSVLVEQKPPLMKVVFVAVPLVFQFLWGGFSSLQSLRQMRHQKEILALATDALEHTAARGDVVIANAHTQQHLDFVHEWRLADSAVLFNGRGQRFGRTRADPSDPMPMQEEKAKMLEAKYGNLSASEREVKMDQLLREWSAGRKVYFVGPESELTELRGDIFNKSAFKIIKRIPLPPAPEPPARRGTFGGRGMPPPGPPLPMQGSPDNNPTFDSGGQDDPGNMIQPPPPPSPPPFRRNGPGRGGRGGFGGGGGFSPDEKELVIAEWQ